MALWFASHTGQPAERVSKRKVVALQHPAIERHPDRPASCIQNQETHTLYLPAGKRQFHDHAASTTETVLYFPENRDTFLVSPFEKNGKKILPAPAPFEKEKVVHRRERQDAPFALELQQATPAGSKGTGTFLNAALGSHHQQRRHYQPGSPRPGSATAMATDGGASPPSIIAHTEERSSPSMPKRSRTPPVGTKLRCDTEGFCVLYSTRPGTGNRVLEMRLVASESTGKSCMRHDDVVIQRREEQCQSQDVNWQRKCTLAMQRQTLLQQSRIENVAKPIGKRRSLTPGGPRERMAVDATPPYATNLPAKYDDVGRSSIPRRFSQRTPLSITTLRAPGAINR